MNQVPPGLGDRTWVTRVCWENPSCSIGAIAIPLFEEELAKMLVGVERNFEAELSATKILAPTVVLDGDPQSIK